MFEKLKSLMSNHVSPGSAIINMHPFSVNIGNSIKPVFDNAVENKELERIKIEVEYLLQLIEEDNFSVLKTQLEQLHSSINSDISQC